MGQSKSAFRFSLFAFLLACLVAGLFAAAFLLFLPTYRTARPRTMVTTLVSIAMPMMPIGVTLVPVMWTATSGLSFVVSLLSVLLPFS